MFQTFARKSTCKKINLGILIGSVEACEFKAIFFFMLINWLKFFGQLITPTSIQQINSLGSNFS